MAGMKNRRVSRWISVQANLHVGGKSAGFANPAGAAGGRRVVVFVIPQVARIDASHVLADIEMAFRPSECYMSEENLLDLPIQQERPGAGAL